MWHSVPQKIVAQLVLKNAQLLKVFYILKLLLLYCTFRHGHVSWAISSTGGMNSRGSVLIIRFSDVNEYDHQ